uniref:Uncharacterized protein n=1 Tax=Plectus sambesii TaxID=2011161 RepID=A0A914XK08_9BILA
MPAKKLVLFSYFLIILLQSQPNVVQADRSAIGTLKFVHALWRHGDRTPSQETFPSDIGNRAETWPQGLGELTMLGVRQQYELGRYLRQRYDGFLSRKYLPYERLYRYSQCPLGGYPAEWRVPLVWPVVAMRLWAIVDATGENRPACRKGLSPIYSQLSCYQFPDPQRDEHLGWVIGRPQRGSNPRPRDW